MKKIKLFKINILLLFILVVISIFPGCDNTDVNSYKTFTSSEGAVHFSFEYSAFFQTPPQINTKNNSQSIEIGAVGVIKP